MTTFAAGLSAAASLKPLLNLYHYHEVVVAEASPRVGTKASCGHVIAGHDVIAIDPTYARTLCPACWEEAQRQIARLEQ